MAYGPNKTLSMSKAGSPNTKSTPESSTTKDASLISEQHPAVIAALDNSVPASEETEASQRKRDTEYEHVYANEEHNKLEKVIEPISDEEYEFSDSDVDDAKDNSLKECYVNIEKTS